MQARGVVHKPCPRLVVWQRQPCRTDRSPRGRTRALIDAEISHSLNVLVGGRSSRVVFLACHVRALTSLHALGTRLAPTDMRPSRRIMSGPKLLCLRMGWLTGLGSTATIYRRTSTRSQRARCSSYSFQSQVPGARSSVPRTCSLYSDTTVCVTLLISRYFSVRHKGMLEFPLCSSTATSSFLKNAVAGDFLKEVPWPSPLA